MACSSVESAAHLTRSYAAFAKLALSVNEANQQDSVQFWESLTKSLQVKDNKGQLTYLAPLA